VCDARVRARHRRQKPFRGRAKIFGRVDLFGDSRQDTFSTTQFSKYKGSKKRVAYATRVVDEQGGEGRLKRPFWVVVGETLLTLAASLALSGVQIGEDGP